MMKTVILTALLMASFFAASAQQISKQIPAHLTLSDLPKSAQISILDNRASEYHTAGDIISLSGAVVALSALQVSSFNSNAKTRVLAGVSFIALGRVLHLIGSHSEKKANRIRFTSNGLSLNF
jgi:hypothetical protein